MKTSAKLLTALLLFFLSFALLADDIRYYDVEVILFENLDKTARGSENWPSSVELELPENLVEIGKPTALPLAKEYEPKLSFTRLKAKEYRLKTQAGKIEESESRRILLHTGWHQPGMPIDTAIPVYFKRKIPAVGSATETDNLQSGTASAPSRFDSAEAGELEGTIKVILARYLHVTADVVFRPEEKKRDRYNHEYENAPALNEPRPLDSETGEKSEVIIEEEQPVVYQLKQTRRRMRSRELHYLDSPVIGMLIMITPHESQVVKKKP